MSVVATTAQWASASATTAGVLVALGIAVAGSRRDARKDRQRELREACMKVAEWATLADEAIRTYDTQQTDAHRKAAIERSNALTTARMHLLLILGLHAPIRKTADEAGTAYFALIKWVEQAGGAGEPEWAKWSEASVKLVDELRALSDYR